MPPAARSQPRMWAWAAALALLLLPDLARPQQSQGAAAAAGQYHDNILHFFVLENSPINTYIGTIRSPDGQPPYLILPSPQTPELERLQALNINTLTGELTTNTNQLDREHREQYHFVAIVKEPFAEIQCTVTVRDINDNAPMFLVDQQWPPPPNTRQIAQAMGSTGEPSTSGSQQQQQQQQISSGPPMSHFLIEVPENQRAVRRQLPVAVDYDSFQFGIAEFRINQSPNIPAGTFRLVEHGAPETKASAQKNLAASDEPGSSILLAAGDNHQLMEQLALQQSSLVPSQPIMQSIPIPAASTASQQAGAITSQTGSFATTNLATVAATSGHQQPSSKYEIDLELNQTLDRENQSTYQLVVEALDKGQPPLVGRLAVTIVVQDVNDNEPIFARKLYECKLREDAAKGTLVIKVQASDADSDSNAQISYFIKGHSSSSSQANNPTNSTTSDNSEVATSNRYATQGANGNKQRHTGTTSATLNSGSKLGQQQQQQQQQRGQQANEIYDSLQASSQESNNFKTKLFSSYNGGQDLFQIPNPAKGEIYLENQLDYETDQMHELLIEARDHGKPAKSGYTVVKVLVLDVNDDPPPPSISRALDAGADKRSTSSSSQALSIDSSRSESGASSSQAVSSSSRLNTGELSDVTQNYLQNMGITSWIAHLNSQALFFIVFVVIIAIACVACFVKMKSLRPKSDYNSVGTHHSAVHQSSSPLLTTPNTTHSSGLPANQHKTPSHGAHNGHGNHVVHVGHGGSLLPLPPLHPPAGRHSSSTVQQAQLPPTPCHPPASAFAWPQTPGSTMGRFVNSSGGVLNVSGVNTGMHGTLPSHSSTLDCRQQTPNSQTFDRLFDLSVPSQLVPAQDWHGSYNWDYLDDWTPKYYTLMPCIQADPCGY